MRPRQENGFLQRLRARLTREPDADLSTELRFHLEMEAANLEKSGELRAPIWPLRIDELLC